MAGSIIKETVLLDKKAREKISELEKEKLDLDSLVKKETKGIKDKYKKDNEEKIAQAKIDFENEIKERKEKEINYFEKHLKNMEEQYKNHKEE
ncbi:hypothetical protein KHQ89_07045 [Mycoplasmatota bacterium]|nr:hypothetical protein KHQ89_07045 [Mycoplasmatota bacterium]